MHGSYTLNVNRDPYSALAWLTASRVFTAIALFNQLRFPLLFYPMVIAAFAEGKVALRRLQAFLDAQEVTERPPEPPLTVPGVHLAGRSTCV